MKSKRTEPYLDVEQYDLKGKSIFDADVYYDAEDNETCIVLRIMTLDNKPQRGIWVRASYLCENNCKGQANMCIQKHNVDMFSQWFNNNNKESWF
jgi:hypothetical protein